LTSVGDTANILVPIIGAVVALVVLAVEFALRYRHVQKRRTDDIDPMARYWTITTALSANDCFELVIRSLRDIGASVAFMSSDHLEVSAISRLEWNRLARQWRFEWWRLNSARISN